MLFPLSSAVALSLLVISAMLSACSDSGNPPRSAGASDAEQLRRAAIDGCKSTIERRTAAFRDHAANQRLFQAVDAMGACATLLGDTALAGEVSALHVKALTNAANNKRATATERLRSFEVLKRLYPEPARSLSALKAVLERDSALEIAKSVATQARADAARKRREGVRVGMSQQDVMDSSWGRPRKINRTTRASGISEQWVYDGGYLYFDNGVLTTIQH